MNLNKLKEKTLIEEILHLKLKLKNIKDEGRDLDQFIDNIVRRAESSVTKIQNEHNDNILETIEKVSEKIDLYINQLIKIKAIIMDDDLIEESQTEAHSSTYLMKDITQETSGYSSLDTMTSVASDMVIPKDESQVSELKKNLKKEDTCDVMLESIKPVYERYIYVQMAHVKNLSEFYLHFNPHEVLPFIHTIQIEQEKVLSSGERTHPSSFSIGNYCAAKYSVDGHWYRALIIHIEYHDNCTEIIPKMVQVKYVDWGNTEKVQMSNIMKLSKELTHPIQAVRCALSCVDSHDAVWNEHITDKFKDIVLGQSLYAYVNDSFFIDDSDDLIYYIDLFKKDKDDDQKINILMELPSFSSIMNSISD